ncbi:MAG: GGDEF domain-containing protein [Pseudohongiellaceae bacterium]
MNTTSSLRSDAQSKKPTAYDQDSWREKYFSSLEDQEKEKIEADSTIDVLRRGLLSVSLAGDGLDISLDSKLSKLRALLKTARDYPSISELLQTIESDLIRLDTQKAEESRKQKQHTSDALALLLNSSIDTEIKKELKDFQKKLKSSHQGADLARKFESELIDLLLPLLTELSSDYAEKNPAEGLWNRFKKSVATSKNIPASGHRTASDNTKLASPEGFEIPQNAGSFVEEESALYQQTKPFVIKLLKQLYDNATVADVAKLLSNEISRADSEALLSRYPKVLNLIELARTQDKKAFLDYLGEINYSLSKIDQSIANSGAIAKKFKSSKRNQNQRLRGGVEKIRTILDTAKDLESAKLKTQETLDEIAENIEAASKIDEQSQVQFQSLLTSQQADLDRLESKTKNITESFDLASDNELQTSRDPLTGLPNQSALNEHLHQQLAFHKEQQQTLCICAGDIAGLTALNEKYGNKAGDKAIELLAREIEKTVMAKDFLSYSGNGQFVLVKNNIIKADAISQAESLKTTITNLPFKFKGDQVKVDLVIATEESTEADSPDTLLEKLNKNLSDAKSSSSSL